MTMTTKFAGITVERNQACTMRDGTVLYADIYRPNTAKELPVLLMRQPYGRAIASTVSHAHPVWYARHGYIVVIQDVRGKWDSEGDFNPFVDDANDGYDTVEWAAMLPGSNGNVGMYGFSYQGSTQWAAAAVAPPHLKAIAPSMCAGDLYHGMFYPFGRLLMREHLPWAYQLARDNAKRAGDAQAEQECSAFMRNAETMFWKLPLDDASNHPLLAKYFPQYFEWCQHEQYDEYWAERDWLATIAKQDSLIPALHIGGWYDVFLMGTIRSYEQLRHLPGGEHHRLIVGPWTHIPWGRHAGGYDHGDQADGNIHHAQLQWFDYWLKGEGEISSPNEAISYYEFGSKQWRTLGSQEQLDSLRLTVTRNDKPANGSLGGGILTTNIENTISHEPDVFVNDARQPVRVESCAPVDRRADQDRYEILVYTSEALEQDVYVFGSPKLFAHCEVLEGKADLVAMLSIVLQDGSCRLLSIGRNEISAENNGGSKPTLVEMKPCAVHFPRGSKVRLELTGSAFPFFTRHPNQSNITPTEAQPLDLRTTTVAIYSEQGHLTYIELPIYEKR